MHLPAARQRLTAWFALLAMWLVVCLPPVSQVLASRQAREPVAELCSGSTASVGQQGQAGHHATTLAKCGYCDLLGTHPLLSSVTAPHNPGCRPYSGCSPLRRSTLSYRSSPAGPAIRATHHVTPDPPTSSANGNTAALTRHSSQRACVLPLQAAYALARASLRSRFEPLFAGGMPQRVRA